MPLIVAFLLISSSIGVAMSGAFTCVPVYERLARGPKLVQWAATIAIAAVHIAMALVLLAPVVEP